MGPDKKASIDINKCVSCGNCVNQCPFGAIQDKSWIVDAVQMIRGGNMWGYKTYAVVAPSIAGQFAPATFGQVVTGLKYLGFTDVSEVALGADMVAEHETEEWAKEGMLTTSCCPGFVGLIKKKYPELAHYVSNTPSPMVAIGLYLKEKDPNAKVIFIGPCIAKKKEFRLGRAMNAVDCVLTYEELFALFQSKEIELTKLEESNLDEATSFGRRFARSGGVTQAVIQMIQEQNLKADFRPVVCNGLAECETALRKLKVNRLEGNFLEGMACEGGCVQGAGCLVRSPKNRMSVEQHAQQAEGRMILSCAHSADKVLEPPLCR